MNTGRRGAAAAAPPDEVEALACACATVRRASRAVTQLYDATLRAHGIEAPQFALLVLLDRLGECNQAEMGRRFDLDKTTLSRNVRLLHRRGWIGFRPGADGRERRIGLTAAGRRRLAAAKPAWREAQQRLRAAMPALDWEEMLGVVDAMTRAARTARRNDVRAAAT